MRNLVAGLALLAAMLPPSPAPAAGGFKARGFFLPDGAVKLDEDRYRLPQAWEDAVKFYRSTYPPAKFPRRTLRNQSGVRAMHITNSSPAEWEGAHAEWVKLIDGYARFRGRLGESAQALAECLDFDVACDRLGSADVQVKPETPPRKAEQPRPRKSGNP